MDTGALRVALGTLAKSGSEAQSGLGRAVTAPVPSEIPDNINYLQLPYNYHFPAGLWVSYFSGPCHSLQQLTCLQPVNAVKTSLEHTSTVKNKPMLV